VRIVNPLQGSRILPYTGKPRTPSEKVERLPNGRMLFRITKTAAQHVRDGGPPAVDMGNFEGGDAVLAAMDGIYRRTPNVAGGNIVTGWHDGNRRTVYAHLSDYNIPDVAAPLEAGAVIGWVGDTGTLVTGKHLHFEWWEDGKAVDPAQFLNGKGSIPTFVDVPASHRFYEEIEWCREHGIFFGSGDRFFPDEPMTREAGAALAFRLAALEDE
jgi:murein DD-endopeptidase MepM/ murein hydrolase activator NlpD